jgi:glycosidase
VAPDTAQFNVYRELIALRKAHLRLFADGGFSWLLTDDARRLLAYDRVLGSERAIVAFNNSDAPQKVSVAADGRYRQAYPAGDTRDAVDGKLSAKLPPRTARVWIRE